MNEQDMEALKGIHKIDHISVFDYEIPDEEVKKIQSYRRWYMINSITYLISDIVFFIFLFQSFSAFWFEYLLVHAVGIFIVSIYVFFPRSLICANSCMICTILFYLAIGVTFNIVMFTLVLANYKLVGSIFGSTIIFSHGVTVFLSILVIFSY